MNRIFISLLLSMLYVSLAIGQSKNSISVKWEAELQDFSKEGQNFTVPVCTDCFNGELTNFLPKYTGSVNLGKSYSTSQVSINVLSYKTLPRSVAKINVAVQADVNDSLIWISGDDRGNSKLQYSFIPVVKLPSGEVKLVEQFEVIFNKNRISTGQKQANFTTNSVLSQGDWYRIGVAADGVYRLNRSDLTALGVNVNDLDPLTLNIYGNAYGQLPYENNVERPDDLQRNTIYIAGENDASFDNGDYILFYGKGPHRWTYDSTEQLFNHSKHDFVDTTYYFIGINTGDAPSRIQNISSSGLSPNYESTTFNDYTFHEVDRQNMIQSGREWYGEKFDIQTTYNFSGSQYTFANLTADTDVVVRANVLSRTLVAGSCQFGLSVNGASDSKSISSTSNGYTAQYGKPASLEVRIANTSTALNINLTYQKNAPSANGWLNWLNVNARRNLRMAGTQMIFRDALSVGPGRVSRFTIDNASNINEVWDVTIPTNPKRISANIVGDLLSFTFPTETLKEFVAFSGGYKSPGLFGRVQNQNLHALGLENRIDMIIVAPAIFADKAEELADLHRNYEPDPLNVEVVKLQNIYNEYSSGMRDVTAIKWFMKMLFDRANGNDAQMTRYLCLFGDGSYDNRNFTAGNTNFIPTYQSAASLVPTDSYVSDDYFAFLSDDEGEGNNDVMDVAVGRLPVKSNQEGTSVINKIKRYMNSDPQSMDQSESKYGAWRNVITLVADAGDGNQHMSNSRTISNQINSYTRDYNIERIFSEAYPQVATPGGNRYPGVSEAIDRRVRKGAFIVNYIGHGGELGWSQSRILNVQTILEWNNSIQLPIFVTATCEFSRFDDPLRTSAGEYVLLNGNGGGIALLTTTRLVYSAPNFRLNREFYKALFDRPANELITRLGDVARECKNGILPEASSNHRNFSLLGDPALPMAIPKHKAVVTSLTDTLGNPVDTLKALGIARVRGEIRTSSGQLKSDFSGRLNATVYDRVEIKSTIRNGSGTTFEFPTQENIVYRGNAEVINGLYQFDFVIPKDISFAVDSTARISLYAKSELTDANGYQDSLNIGSRDPDAINDGSGPNMDLYLNDENFVFGGYTNDTPILIASIFDENGINTVGSGIGHDITGILDDNPNKSIVLNDYYETDLNTFKSGKINYQFDKLEPGNHKLKVKIWDVHNNSSEGEIEFLVSNDENFSIQRVLNYPNPFTTHTEFFFEHNQSSEFLNVLVQIFTISGKLAKSINVVSNTDGFRNEGIAWDGRDDYGDRLATGVYVYKISVRSASGEQVEKFEKLVILN